MRRGHGHRTSALFLLTLPALAVTAAEPPAKGQPRSEAAPSIELHVGIPDLVHIRQPLADLQMLFPAAQVAPFAGQEDAAIVRIPAAGISCIVVGTPGDLKVASLGFNLDGAYEGMAEGNFRTSKGIGKGSTVNDLLEAYGEPLEILGEKVRVAPRRGSPLDDPAAPKMYQYASEDGSVKTFFLVQDHLVKRLVVNELAPLEKHVVKGSPKK